MGMVTDRLTCLTISIDFVFYPVLKFCNLTHSLKTKFLLKWKLLLIVDTIQENRLGIEPVTQAMLLQTPTPGCIIVAGGTVERWDILSSELSPGNPCSLAQKWKCIIEQNLDKYAANVQWIFYSSCERWYHQISPRCASTTMVTTVTG